jgi:hypothetical protein
VQVESERVISCPANMTSAGGRCRLVQLGLPPMPSCTPWKFSCGMAITLRYALARIAEKSFVFRRVDPLPARLRRPVLRILWAARWSTTRTPRLMRNFLQEPGFSLQRHR